jgi:hypothetical protein
LTGRLAAIAQAHALLSLPFDAKDPGLRKICKASRAPMTPDPNAGRRRCSPPM